MNTQEMIANLQAQIDALAATSGEFAVRGFNVWYPNENISTVRVERNTWSWGYCKSETCNHNSHDPYTEGDTQFVLCRPVGVASTDDSDNRCERYECHDGQVIEFVQGDDNSHYAPIARLEYADPGRRLTPIPERETVAAGRW